MRLKILIFFLAVAFLTGTTLTAYWWWANIDRPAAQVEARLKELDSQARQGKLPDPGRHVFERGVERLREGEVEAARQEFLKVARVYKDSATWREARRVLGEIHIDRLFSRNPMPGKHDYTVKAGDSLLRIERGSLTTIPFLHRLNNLSGTMLQPGERLVYQPLEFEMEVHLEEKRLTLLQKVPNGKSYEFFKDYEIRSVALPPGVPRSFTTKIQEKAAFLGEKKVSPTDPAYAAARKWLQTTSRGARLGIPLRPHSEITDPELAADNALPYGLFFDDADVEELSTIIRPGTVVRINP